MSSDPDQIETIATGIHAISQTRAAAPKERFPPGTLLASRYRIISRLGKGGMGEVFRADDLILGQQVALKFLPESAIRNVKLLSRFYDEVRLARQISHKNVCRMYDIGEFEGQPYLSMEYIDGEDLGSLLRRIGRLPAAKATEFARKLCAGVAAAHAQGILHRDLKPANIMIDSRGDLRVTDFGLAAIAEQLEGDEVRNGTPAYMAPEQLTGREVSVQSDLYAVGLILYEMFTGKMPFEADTIAEMTRLRQESRVTNPSTLAGDLDKSVEHAILRCLQPDPKMRPESAIALAAALPGGDPLAAALADGETPSPELVAAAGSHEGLSLKIGVPAVAAIAAGLAIFCFATPRIHLDTLLPLENPPEALTVKAREFVKSIGYPERPTDSAFSFYPDFGILQFLRSEGHNMEEWRRAFAEYPSPLGFLYRQGREPLAVFNITANGEVDALDPPLTVPGMILVEMDQDAILRKFVAVPPEHEASPSNTAAPDWKRFFDAAHLDLTKFSASSPEWSPTTVVDSRAAWTGPYKDRNTLSIRVEAASFHNLPVYFEIVWPWTQPMRTSDPGAKSQAVGRFAAYALGVLVVIAALCLAWYNWKAGRGDLRGATRVGIYVALMRFLTWLFLTHHVGSDAEQTLFSYGLANAAYVFVEYWLIYLALEPWVRRYWPQALITWTRVLAGKWRDPMVGRDLLFGTLWGVVYLLLVAIYEWVNVRLGISQTGAFDITLLNGFHKFAGSISAQLFGDVSGSLVFFLTLFLVRALLKKQWLVAPLWILIWVAVRLLRNNYLAGDPARIPTVVFWLLLFSILVFIMLRLGFFAFVVAAFVLDTTTNTFFTTDFAAWYGQSSLAIVVLVVALALVGFRLSLGSGPIFKSLSVES
jgi:serine/threonine-protein kinase